MGTITNGLCCSAIPSAAKPLALQNACSGRRSSSSLLPKKASGSSTTSARSRRRSAIRCLNPESGVEEDLRKISSPASPPPPLRRTRMEDYNTVMKRMMRNPYEYHHDLEIGMLAVMLLGSSCLLSILYFKILSFQPLVAGRFRLYMCWIGVLEGKFWKVESGRQKRSRAVNCTKNASPLCHFDGNHIFRRINETVEALMSTQDY